MPRNPPDVRHAREAVTLVYVEDVLDGERGAEEVSARGVHDALGLPGRAGGLEKYKYEQMGKWKGDARRG
jgi:hypothetical protein